MPEYQRAGELLANERTFLAWIRTSVTIISFGLVVAKFGVWLQSLVTRASPESVPHQPEPSLLMGVAMMILGGVLALLAAWRYHVVNRNIERGEVKADRGLVALVTILVLALAAIMIFFMYSARL